MKHYLEQQHFLMIAWLYPGKIDSWMISSHHLWSQEIWCDQIPFNEPLRRHHDPMRFHSLPPHSLGSINQPISIWSCQFWCCASRDFILSLHQFSTHLFQIFVSCLRSQFCCYGCFSPAYRSFESIRSISQCFFYCFIWGQSLQKFSQSCYWFRHLLHPICQFRS